MAAIYPTMRVERTHPIAALHGIYGRGSPNAIKCSIYVHKWVLYEKLGYGPHQCHWCHRTLNWQKGTAGDTLIADHLDDNPRNNDPDNLVAACNGCNTIRARTAFRPAIQPGEWFIERNGLKSRAAWCTCEECGTGFLADISRIKRGTVRTCSRRCSTFIGLRSRWGYERPAA